MSDPSDFLAPRRCLRAPLPEHEAAADLLADAADAVVAGDLDLARDRLRQADMPALFAFARTLMGPVDPDIHRRRPVSPRDRHGHEGGRTDAKPRGNQGAASSRRLAVQILRMPGGVPAGEKCHASQRARGHPLGRV